MYKITIFDITSRSTTEFTCEECDGRSYDDISFTINDNTEKIFIPPSTIITIEDIPDETDETFS